LCKTRGKLSEGEKVTLRNAAGGDDIRLQLVARLPDGGWACRAESSEETFSLLERVGRVPLPPYIRKGEMRPEDRQNYQTVYAATPGAVAAPTAGLHFTAKLLEQLQSVGVTLCHLALHVGAGTFRPIKSEVLAEHPMHYEWGRITEETVRQIEACRNGGGRVVAVGTTVVRLLETAAAGGSLRAFAGPTNLFIRPPYQFRAIDALLTNFHLPRTTLLILVQTFGGDELIRRAYQEAIREEYRFYSYGDAMLIV
jgi:S-adenosylmethionine:tRNA ribosyltransferase-isomerase